VLTASAGIAVVTAEQPETGISLLQKADAALYAAKREGRDHVVMHHAGLSSAKQV
jgi:PleD family two-component response regulator